MSENIDKLSQDACDDQNIKKEKADWSPTYVEAYVRICVSEVLAGNTKGGHLSKLGWRNVIGKFNKFTQKTWSQKQVKNKWTSLKKDWQLWTTLIGKETGLGWDRVKNTIDASNEWWETKIKANAAVKHFRTKGLQNVDLLDILFKDNAVTGESAWAPSQVMVHDLDSALARLGQKDQDDSRMLGQKGKGPQGDEDDFDDDSGIENIANNSTQPSTQNREPKRKRSGLGVQVKDKLDELLNAVQNRGTTSSSKDRPGCSIEEVMEVVERMPEIKDDDGLFLKTADILTEKKNREMFVALKQSDRQLLWLKNKKV